MPGGVTYDTGALLAAERNHRAMWALHRRALERNLVPTVPAGSLAQAWRGGPQAELSLLLQGCRIEPLDRSLARSSGTLCGQAKSSDIIDASVVVGASARGDLIVSSDRRDLEHLVSVLGSKVQVEAI